MPERKDQLLIFFRGRNLRAVTRRAILGRWLVKEDGFPGHAPDKFVALIAVHLLMRPTQGKLRPRVMIEQGGLPFHRVVAFSTPRDFALRKLFSMDVFMALFASGGRGLEVHVAKFGSRS